MPSRHRLTLLQSIANSGNSRAFAHKVRRKRQKIFESYFQEMLVNKPIKILDVGGTFDFWKQMGYDKNTNVQILLLNLMAEQVDSENIRSIVGDACDLSQFCDKQFDIVFSNSVIEHVGNHQRQIVMAKEILRVGKNYFVQTPNYWFPFEPHFLIFGFQYLPVSMKAFLVQKFNFGWLGRQNDKKKALELADSVHLLSKRRLKKLFPDSIIVNEYFLGLTKSMILLNKQIVYVGKDRII